MDDRRVPRTANEPCAVCDGKGWVRRPQNPKKPDGDTVTMNCPACTIPTASRK